MNREHPQVMLQRQRRISLTLLMLMALLTGWVLL
jgi:hypothetical protein